MWFVTAVFFTVVGIFFLNLPVSESAQPVKQTLFLMMVLVTAVLTTIGLWRYATHPHTIALHDQNTLRFISRTNVEAYPLTACRKITRHKHKTSSWTTSAKGKQTSRILSFELTAKDGMVQKRFELHQHKDRALEQFVSALEKIAPIDTEDFWMWGAAHKKQ